MNICSDGKRRSFLKTTSVIMHVFVLFAMIQIYLILMHELITDIFLSIISVDVFLLSVKWLHGLY